MVVGAIVMTFQRYNLVDFPMPYLWTSIGVIVPAPKSTTSVSTLFHPWKLEVKYNNPTASHIIFKFNALNRFGLGLY